MSWTAVTLIIILHMNNLFVFVKYNLNSVKIISSFSFMIVYCNSHSILNRCLSIIEYIHRIDLN